MSRILVLEELVGLSSDSHHSLSQGAEPLTLSSELDYLFETGPLTPQELIARLERDPTIKGLICPLSQRVTDEVFQRAPQLKVVANLAVGLNNIDLSSARERGVRVAHTPGVLTEATADLAWALLLGGVRRIVEGDQLARSGAWSGWEMNQLLGSSIGGRGVGEGGGKTLGVIGLGAIGQAVARRAVGFQLAVSYYSRTRKLDLEASEGWRYQPLDELVSAVDYLVLCAPLTSETHHLLDRTRILSMRPHAYLINVGRGPLIDEEALINALEAGHLSGAALDVYEREPQIPQRLRALPQVTLSPHLGSATYEARREMSHLALSAVREVLTGASESDAVFAV